MTDIGSANERSILGTNIRFIFNNKIVNRNIGMSLITEHHKSPVLRDMIFEQLPKVGVAKDQLISFVADNAKNMSSVSYEH